MHIVSKEKDLSRIKKEIREELEEHHICHSILETEEEVCGDQECHVEFHEMSHHNHH